MCSLLNEIISFFKAVPSLVVAAEEVIDRWMKKMDLMAFGQREIYHVKKGWNVVKKKESKVLCCYSLWLQLFPNWTKCLPLQRLCSITSQERWCSPSLPIILLLFRKSILVYFILFLVETDRKFFLNMYVYPQNLYWETQITCME